MNTAARSIASAVKELGNALEFNASPAYLQKKYEEHRKFTFILLMLLCMAAVTSWSVDWMIDPVGARRSIWVRLAFIPAIVLPALAVLRARGNRQALPFLGVIAVLTVFQQLLILTLLEGGFTYGIALFLYFPFGIMVVGLGAPFRTGLCFLALVTLMPPLLFALTGWPAGFPLGLYAVVMWPATVMTALVSASFASSYYKRQLLERALEQASNTDPLTGVANRRQFEVLLRREIARSQRKPHACALLMLDIDHFKRINDGHGHPTGDRVICALADPCVASSRAPDLVARLGGEEFGILMPAASADEGLHLAERIRAEVQSLVIRSDADAEVRWTVSIGVAFARPAPNDDLPASCEHLIRHADAALYRAKTGGRNRVELHGGDASAPAGKRAARAHATPGACAPVLRPPGR